MKRTVSIALVFCFLCSLAAFTESGAMYAPGGYCGVQWGASAEEIKQVMGEDCDMQSLSELAYILDYSSKEEKIQYGFIVCNERLLCGDTLLHDRGLEDYYTYVDAFSEMYGDSESGYDFAYEFMNGLYGQILTEWLDEDYLVGFLNELQAYAGWHQDGLSILISFSGRTIEIICMDYSQTDEQTTVN